MATVRHYVFSQYMMIFFAGLGILLSILFMTVMNKYRPQNRVAFATPVVIDAAITPTAYTRVAVAVPVVAVDTAMPTPMPRFVPQETTASQDSSDGKAILTMRTISESSGVIKYSFFVTDATSPVEKLVYETTLPAEYSLSIPYNTWSPDNRYFFIQGKDASGDVVRVFRATGEPFADGSAYLDAVAAYTAGTHTDLFREATGWASETLILMNTTTPTGEKGASYWFEVPSRAVMQLGIQF